MRRTTLLHGICSAKSTMGSELRIPVSRKPAFHVMVCQESMSYCGLPVVPFSSNQSATICPPYVAIFVYSRSQLEEHLHTNSGGVSSQGCSCTNPCRPQAPPLPWQAQRQSPHGHSVPSSRTSSTELLGTLSWLGRAKCVLWLARSAVHPPVTPHTIINIP